MAHVFVYGVAMPADILASHRVSLPTILGHKLYSFTFIIIV